MSEITINWQTSMLKDDLVQLVPLTDEDFEALYQIASDPLIWEQHPTKDRYKRNVFQLFFDGATASKSAFLIKDKALDATIGSTRYYDYQPGHASIAIGYTFLARQYWGGKYNRAIKKILLDYAFQFVDKVYFHIGTENIRSQIAIGNLGAEKIREVQLGDYGQAVAHYEYVIDKRNWET
ncbi:MAG: GNAT family N-acetyltransferase [Chitinophagaceae bacterium]